MGDNLQPRTIIHVLASGDWGGPERYAFDICRYFKDCGWNVSVLTRDARAVDNCFLENDIPISHAPLRDYPDYYSAREMARLFSKIPRGEGIVHVHRYNDALTCILARKLSGRPDIRLVATRHKAEVGRDSMLRRVIYRGIDSHLFVSEYSKQKFFEGWKPGESPLKEEKTSVTYNSLFNAGDEACPEPEKGPIVMAYRGRLKPGKGIESLLEAMEKVKDLKVRLKMVGKGQPDFVDHIRSIALQRGVINQIDWLRHTEFPQKVLRDIHFGVFPSEAPEAFGMANMEVMAFGRPQISTLEGALTELLVPGETAIKVTPGNSEELASAIRTLATDAELRRKMGSQAFQYYTDNFSWQKFLDRLMPAYLPDRQ